MKKVLITGAGGFIGSQLIEKFIEEGYKVECWDRNDMYEKQYKICKVDICCTEKVINSLNMFNPDIVIHCAGCADVGKSVKNPEIDYNGNVTLTHRLLFAIHKSGLDNVKFIFLSSAAVYGNPSSLPIMENMKLKPLSPYALHKVMCEDICRYFYSNYDMDIKILRIFSAYGNGLKKQIFWDMYQKIVQTGQLSMFGTGNESRDYINIADLVNAVYMVATRASKRELIYNIANGEEITIRQAVECFADVAGIARKKISFSGEEKEGNPINWKADISKLKALGYNKMVDFRIGIEQYLDWIREL